MATPPAARVTSAAGLVPAWIGVAVRDVQGAWLGHVADVLFDERTRAPGWLLVALADDRHVLAPARGLRHRAGAVQLACDGERARSAPPAAAPPDGLTRSHVLAIAAHYGVRCGAGPWHGVVEPSVARAALRRRVAA